MVAFPLSVRLALAMAISAAACSAAPEATGPSKATIAVLSGGDQLVSLALSPNALLPEPVVIYAEEDDHPASYGSVRVQVTMDGAPGPNGAYYFGLGEDGKGSLRFSASPTARGFSVRIEYGHCTGFKSCDSFRALAVATTRGTVIP